VAKLTPRPPYPPPGIHRIGDWVDSRTGLEGHGGEKNLSHIEVRFPDRPVRSESTGNLWIQITQKGKNWTIAPCIPTDALNKFSRSINVLYRLATGWTVPGSNPRGVEIFRTCPDGPWGLPSLLYNGYRVSFPGAKQTGRGANQPPPSSAEVKGRVELHLYSPSGPSWPVLGRTLPFY
jgi:hypothetical protein